MKYFFYSFEEMEDQEGILEKYIETMKEGKGDPNTIYKVIYDMVDYIYDKRFDINNDAADEELKKITNDNFETKINKLFSNKLYFNKCSNEDKEKNSKEVQKIERIIAFKKLYNIVEEYRNKIDTSDNVMYYLTKGNICSRISEVYMRYNNYEKSDRWGLLAIDVIFHGKIVATNQRDEIREGNVIFCKEKEHELNLYIRLIKLNLAKYYRDYALKNRRSDFEAAKDEFEHIKRRINEDIPQIKPDDFENLSYTKILRQYSLILMDVEIDEIYILRYQYQNDNAKEVVSRLYNDLVFVCSSIEKYKEFKLELNEKVEHIEIFRKIFEELFITSRQNSNINRDIINILRNLTDYDKNRYLLLTILEMDKITRSLHNEENYQKSIFLAIMADKWSKKIDNHTGNDQHNVDAMYILSVSLRKYIKFQYENYKIIEEMINLLLFSNQFVNNSEEKYNTKLLSKFFKIHEKYMRLGIKKSEEELIKWDCLSLELWDQELSSIIKEISDKKPIDDNKNEELKKENLQLLFLEGFQFVRQNRYKKAIKKFDKIINDYKEANYIRVGTIGLKTKYLRAKCYIALLRFGEAKKELLELQNTLRKSKQSQGDSNKNKVEQIDLRISIDLGYCYIQRSEYKEAIDVYEGIYIEDESKESNYTEDSFNRTIRDLIKPANYIMGLNNFARCLILCEEKNSSHVKAVFEQIERVSGEVWEKDRETNYLKGLYCLRFGKNPENDTSEDNNQNNTDKEYERYLLAHKYFKIACGYEQGFIYDHYLKNSNYNHHVFSESHFKDKAKTKNDVARISAYVIDLCNLYNYSEEEPLKKKYKSSIQRFILGLPSACKLSLKAATALADWILKFEESDEKELYNQLLRSFSYIGIYEERGARAFNELKYDSKFRLFSAYNRGKLLAYLLKLYKPIKEIKEELCLPEKKSLTHYTKMETLKILLDEKKDSSMRINNCGYMNDIFEGTAFLNLLQEECLKYVRQEGVCIKEEEQEKESERIYKEIINNCFPQIQRQSNNMLPIGSNVYIMSLSDNKDSFPMWTIYSENESGCNIEFPEDFFDIFEKLTENDYLKEYLMSNYKDTDYPIYKVQYYTEDKNLNGIPNDIPNNVSNGISLDMSKSFETMIGEWKKMIEYIDMDLKKDDCSVIYEFVADRLNEIRFLFKNNNYEYEREYRIVYTAKKHSTERGQGKSEEKIDNTTTHPRVYVDLDRKIENITVRLGSKIDDHSVDKYVTWLMHTGRVTTVGLSERNRYTNKMQ